MSLQISDKEFESVIKLPSTKRYSYFIKRVVDFEEIWSLYEDGWCLAGDKEGNEYVPVWPAKKYAEACAFGKWKSYTPKTIDLYVWIDRWIPGMKNDNRKVNIFPTPNDDGVVIDSIRMKIDLEKELRKYE